MSNVSKTIDIKDIVVSNQTHGVEDITCGGSLNNPIHKLSKKIEKSIFQGISISTPTEEDRNFIYRDEEDNVMVVDKVPGESRYVWQRVTDANSLNVGDEIIIVASNYGYALSTVQNNNNRGAAAVEKSGNDNEYIETLNDDVQIIVLEKNDDKWTFPVDGGYLYAASSSKNYLKTQAVLDDNGKWVINIADNNASVVAQGNYTRNMIQYNTGVLFSCYSSAQQPIQLYKKTEISVPDIYKWKTLVSNDDIDVITEEELDEMLVPQCNPGNLIDC